MSFLGRLFIWLRSLLDTVWGLIRLTPISDAYLTRQYTVTACAFAERISEITVKPQLQSTGGYQISVEDLLLEWEEIEQTYLKRGFRSIPLSDFIDHVAWSAPLENVGVIRAKREIPVFHAYNYRLYYLHRKSVVRDLRMVLLDEGLLDFEPTRKNKRL